MYYLKMSNLVLSFLLELYALFMSGYWGLTFKFDKSLNVLIGLLIPVMLMILWGILCAPSSVYRLSGFKLIALKVLIFGGIALLLLSMHYPRQATIFVVLVVVNLSINGYFKTI
ncbi:MAG: YrdB family protein [Lactococcus chungangensis]|jgi:Protein of unknown function (DUF2568).|uniref:YrdB family protein n=2 Tax=Pseudolactococcus chungangensis TaxID=451457 RepID=A0A847J209_9LACT|nr:DUF2568 domain-containing protein [Bacilli bacterium]NLH34682.1 YrdB family protein [Lactococcus chungangensis]